MQRGFTITILAIWIRAMFEKQYNVPFETQAYRSLEDGFTPIVVVQFSSASDKGMEVPVV